MITIINQCFILIRYKKGNFVYDCTVTAMTYLESSATLKNKSGNKIELNINL